MTGRKSGEVVAVVARRNVMVAIRDFMLERERKQGSAL